VVLYIENLQPKVCCTLFYYAFSVTETGNTVPPFLIYPRVHFLAHVLNDAPEASHGDANPTGWMKAELFLRFVKHFVYM
jgi:hypothetical protein